MKTIIDLDAGEALYFQDTRAFPFHRAFAIEHLAHPPAAPFANEYYSDDRRFLLGAVTRHGAAKVFVYELAPYDNATPAAIGRALAPTAP